MVRKANEEDIEIINSFKTKLSLSRLRYNSPSLDILNNNVLDDNNVCLLALKDNKKIGYLYGYKYKNKAILDQIYIMDEYRENGIGEELVMEFKNWASYNLLNNIEVNIENGNDAYFLFDKLDFQISNVTMNLDI